MRRARPGSTTSCCPTRGGTSSWASAPSATAIRPPTWARSPPFWNPGTTRALKLRAQGIDITSSQPSIAAVLRSVHDEPPDLRPHAAPDGTVTIMFSDIEGSTALAERLGDRRFIELLREHNTIV